MVLIVTSFGATKNYPDRKMMEKTFGMFLDSLRAQTDPDFRLFVSYHDHPGEQFNEPWIEWRSIAVPGNETFNKARIPMFLPTNLKDEIRYGDVCGKGKMADSGRKVLNSLIEAGRWALREGKHEFWILRMDSDDLLWNGMVEFLNDRARRGIEAVFNRKCHMLDAQTGRMAVHSYPQSTTCNALRYKIKDDGVIHPDWFYHCIDHTTFGRSVRKDGFVCEEKDFTLCIMTNSGNSISNRPPVERERYNRMVEIGKPLMERYGIRGVTA